MSSNQCPSHQQLQAYLEGRLPLGLLDSLSPHVESCPSCLSDLAELEKVSRARGGTKGLNLQGGSTLSHLPRRIAEGEGNSQTPPTVAAFWTELERSRLFTTDELAILCRQIERHYGSDISPSGIANWLIGHGRLTRYQSTLLFQGQGGQLLVGEYELLEPLGTGGMGQVFKARQRRLNRVVALKMILAGHFASSEEVQRFYSEAESAAQLNHQGIVPVYEVNEAVGRHYFSMAYVEGECLQDRLAKGPLPPREAAEIVRQVADAVHYAHERGVIHRDLKPRNILITPNHQPLVTDFGLAKRLGSDSDLTHTGQVLGTPSFMAPEQAAGKVREIGPPSDVYSLGAVLYTLLCARPPFQSENAVETIRQVLEQAPAAPRLLNAAIPRDLETICLKCLEKSQQNRPRSAKELADELSRFLRGDPIRSRRIGPLQHTWRWCRRNPYAVGIAALLLIVAGFGVVAASLARQSREATQIAELTSDIQSQIDELANGLTREKLDGLDQKIRALQLLHPERAKDAAEREAEKIAQSLQQRALGQLSQEDIQALEPFLAPVAQLDPAMAAHLRQTLQARATEWQTTAQWQAPWTSVPPEFSPDSAQVADGVLRCQPQTVAGHAAKICWVAVPSPGYSHMEVRFVSGWDQCRSVGIVLNGEGSHGYDLILRPDPDVSGVASDRSLADERAAGRDVVVDLLRRGALLSRERFPAWKLPAGELRMWLRRTDDELSWQLAEISAPRQFLDPFAEPAGETPRFGLLGEGILPIQEIVLRRRSVPSDPTALDRATAAYHRGELDEALRGFAQEAETGILPESRQQALFKQAVCELKLQRRDDAVKHLESLRLQAGDRWPVLAACQLWLVYVLDKNFSAAQELQAAMRGRFQSVNLTDLVTADDRRQIAATLAPQQVVAGTIRVVSDADVKQLEHIIATYRLLHIDDATFKDLLFRLMRAYMYRNDNGQALSVAEELAERFPDGGVYRNYVRLLRWSGKPREALEVLNRLLAERNFEPHTLAFYLEMRARVHRDLEDRFSAESDLRRALALPGNGDDKVPIYLLLGSLLEEQGNLAAARQIWQAGFEACKRPMIESKHLPDHTGLPQTIMLGVLGGAATDEELLAIAMQMVDPQYANVLAPAAALGFSTKGMTRALRTMFARSRGRTRAAEAFIWETTSLANRTRALVTIAISEYFLQNLFSGDPTTIEEELAEALAEELYEAAVVDATLDLKKDAALFLFAWRSPATENIEEIRKKLPPRVWPALHDMVGRRMLMLDDPDGAKLQFEEALRLAKSETASAAFASESLKLLQRQQGLLRVVNRYAQPLELVMTSETGDTSRHALAAAQTSEVTLAPGKVAVSLAQKPDGVALSASSIVVPLARPVTLRINWAYAPATDVPSMPGILLQPQRLSDGRRWQVDARLPRENWMSLAYSADQKSVLLGSDAGNIREIDAASGELRRAYPGHLSRVTSIRVSPASGRIATGSYDHVIRLFDPSGRTIKRGQSPIYSVFDIEWNADELAVSGFGKEWLVVDRNGDVVHKVNAGQNPQAIDWKPVSKQLTLAFNNEIVLQQVDGTRTRLLTAGGRIRRARWSADGQHLAVLCENRVELYDPTGRKMADWSSEESQIYDLQWFPKSPRFVISTPRSVQVHHADGSLDRSHSLLDCQRFTVGHSDDRILVLERGRELRELVDGGQWRTIVSNPSQAITDLAVLPDGRLAWTGDGSRVQIVDEQLAPQRSWDVANWTRAVAVDPTGKRLAVGGGKVVAVCDPDTGVLQRFDVPSEVRSVCWSPDGTRIAAGTQGGSLHVWRDDGSLVLEDVSPRGLVNDVDWHPREDRIAIACNDGAAAVWDLSSTRVARLATLSGAVRGLRWSPDGTTLAGSGAHATVTILQPDGTVVGKTPYLESDVYALEWLDDDRIAVGTQDSRIIICNPKGQITRTLQQGTGMITSLFVDRARNELWSGGKLAIGCWDTALGTPLRSGIILSNPQVGIAALSAGGQPLRMPLRADQELIYLVEEADGSLAHFPPAVFRAHFGTE